MNRKDHYFVYIYDKNGKRTGHTICLLLRDGKMFHGESLCANTDQFNKKIGRQIAFNRAMEAFNKHRTSIGYLADQLGLTSAELKNALDSRK